MDIKFEIDKLTKQVAKLEKAKRTTSTSNSSNPLSTVPTTIMGKPIVDQKLTDGQTLVYNATKKQWEAATPQTGGAFSGTMDDIDDGATYVKTENNLTDALVSTINTALQSETSHADVLVDSDIGVTVQGYNANTVVDASYVHTDNNFTDAQETAVNALVLNNFAAVLPPAVTNDITEGYSVGSKWVDTSADKVYICVDSSEDTAVWIIIPTVDDTAYNATSWDGNTDAPTKNAVRDKFESLSSGGLTQQQVEGFI